MEKSPEAFRTISEVAALLDTPAHVLRFWESRFPQIRPVKRAGGRRYYRPADVDLLTGIKRLLHDDGLTIRGVQKILREQGVRFVSGAVDPETDEADMAVDVPVQPITKTSVVPFTRPAPAPRPEDEPDLFSTAWATAAPTPAEAADDGVSDADSDDDGDDVTGDNLFIEPDEAQPDAPVEATDSSEALPEGPDADQGDAPAEVVAAPQHPEAAEQQPAEAETPVEAATEAEPPVAAEAEPPEDPAKPQADAAAEPIGQEQRRDESRPDAVRDANDDRNPGPTPAAPEELTGHWLAADLRALRPADIADQAGALIPLADRLKGLRDRVADLGRVPRR